MNESPQLTKLTLDMGALTFDLPISHDSLVNVQGKAAKFPSDFFIKGTQPLVKGCSVKVDYINEEAETKNNFLNYKDEVQELVFKINSALEIENPDPAFLKGFIHVSEDLNSKISNDVSLTRP